MLSRWLLWLIPTSSFVRARFHQEGGCLTSFHLSGGGAVFTQLLLEFTNEGLLPLLFITIVIAIIIGVHYFGLSFHRSFS